MCACQGTEWINPPIHRPKGEIRDPPPFRNPILRSRTSLSGENLILDGATHTKLLTNNRSLR
uniref:Uncharacterized protein n=1 Tax=Romanomermis culicivorax TaxID=13658 RepID=A0A915JFZ1_ROMCU